MAIPKIIHYCWFGEKELPEELKQCMKTWDVLANSGYEIKRWDESNCNFDECDFVKKAYKKKKWGFIGDYYRVKALYEYGGIYLDTDIIVNKVFDDLLDNKAFIGFFYNVALCTAVVGAEKGSIYIKNILNMYETGNYETEKTVLYGAEYVDLYEKEFLIPSNECWTWCTIKNNQKFKLNNKKQELNDVIVYPKEYFETGAIFCDWYTRHLNTNSWKEKVESSRFFSYIKKRMKSSQLLWTACRKFKLRKAQKSTSFYRNKERIGI